MVALADSIKRNCDGGSQSRCSFGVNGQIWMFKRGVLSSDVVLMPMNVITRSSESTFIYPRVRALEHSSNIRPCSRLFFRVPPDINCLVCLNVCPLVFTGVHTGHTRNA
jgi:hypothetical protein